MNKEFDWLTLDSDEEVIWHGNPKIQRLIGFTFTDYVVTNQALYRKSGIFSRNVQKIGLDKVQNISFSQGLLGKNFGYGNVDISTAGGSGVEMRFLGIQEPKTVQETINRQTKTDKKGSEKTEKDLLKAILGELQELNENLS
ncbi:PH domain-containing protein [Candidatus Nanohalococcus occultus]|uniref:Membrane protein, contains bPH2 domain n=1 Tax=Candidatus Nanohalococcus occultus TaxID=2978047 RepID=A0ABY8CFE0_9ARCH|nr:putative membrane protein, contains bPH2 domain [Candidatus Nanohaloarchaeota archaeon SVXNc]